MRFFANNARNEPDFIAANPDHGSIGVVDRRDPAIALAVLDPLVSMPLKQIENHWSTYPQIDPRALGLTARGSFEKLTSAAAEPAGCVQGADRPAEVGRRRRGGLDQVDLAVAVLANLGLAAAERLGAGVVGQVRRQLRHLRQHHNPDRPDALPARRPQCSAWSCGRSS